MSHTSPHLYDHFVPDTRNLDPLASVSKAWDAEREKMALTPGTT